MKDYIYINWWISDSGEKQIEGIYNHLYDAVVKSIRLEEKLNVRVYVDYILFDNPGFDETEAQMFAAMIFNSDLFGHQDDVVDKARELMNNYDWDTLVSYMDTDICEDLHIAVAPTTEINFLVLYMCKHFIAFGHLFDI